MNVKFAILRDHIPLKQGLRPYVEKYTNGFIYRVLRDHIPLKQGLRPLRFTRTRRVIDLLRDHIPLKQGLLSHGDKICVGRYAARA